MFSLFERLLKPTDPPEQAEPPPGFVAFFWHFARQAKGLFAALFAAGLAVALLDSTIPVFMGRIVTLITASTPGWRYGRRSRSGRMPRTGAPHTSGSAT
jgi:ATP-binding cassette, subfamily B, multidrug efflux pump